MADSDNYPEILADLAAMVGEALQRQGVPGDRAAEIGHDAAEFVRARWSGQQIYLPKGLHYELERRDLEIWHKFNGHNHAQLAREYGLTEMRIYQIVKRVRAMETKRRQPELFPIKDVGR